jgi:hypothetical protein
LDASGITDQTLGRMLRLGISEVEQRLGNHAPLFVLLPLRRSDNRRDCLVIL